MKTINLNRLLSLLLSLVMVFSVIYIASPSAYADDPIITPQLFEGGETIDVDSCGVNWVRGVTDEFKNGSHVIAATVENYPAEALSKPKNHYLVGKITVYLDKLPTESDMTSDGKLPSVKIKLPIKDDKVNWNGYDEQGTIAIKFNTTAGTEASFSNAYIVTPVGAQLYSSYCLTCKIDKTTYYYDYIIQVKDKNANIINGAAVRNRIDSASVSFNLSSDANLFYLVSDSKLDNPSVDTSGQGMESSAGLVSFDINNLTGSSAKYLYLVAKCDNVISGPYEIEIPAIKYNLKHEKQQLPGFNAGPFYTEHFINENGAEVTSAVPGEIITVELGVFGINNSYTTYSNGVFEYAGIRNCTLSGWSISGIEQSVNSGYSFSFTMPENDVTIQAETIETGVPLATRINGNVTDVEVHLEAFIDSDVGYSYTLEGEDSILVKPGTDVMAWAFIGSPAYDITAIRIYNNNELVNESLIERNVEFIPQFNWAGNAHTVVAEGGNYIFEFVFQAKPFASVTVDAEETTMGSASASVEGGSPQLVYAGQTVTLTAVPNTGYVLKEWQVKDEDGTVIDVTPDAENANKATFVMPATGKDITATAIFEADHVPSSACALTDIVLTDLQGKSYDNWTKQGTAFTITLPAGTDVSSLAQWPLTLEISDGATVAKNGDASWTNGAACGMALNTPQTFTVTAEDRETSQEYTVEIVMEEVVNVAQSSLTLNGDIGVNFYLRIPDSFVDSAYVCINFRGETKRYKVSEVTPSDGMYKFTAKTYATEMRAPIVLTVEDASGNKIKLMNAKSTIDYTESGYTYSIERYFTLAREQYTAYPKVIALVNAMDEYGKYAQNYFSNSNLEVGDVSDVTLAVLEQYKMVRTDMPAGLEYGGTTLVLDSTTAYRHYFKAASGHSLDEFTFTIDGVTQTLKEKDGKYYIEVSDIRADKLNEFKTLVISNGTSETYSIKYCALSYARTAVNQNLEMANVTRALYKYFVAADAYF